MTNKPWKQFERDVGVLIGGKRHPANTGGSVDAESDTFVAQCKNVKALSLAALERLAREITFHGKLDNKIGVVAVKRRAGAGIPTETLMVLSERAWLELLRRAGNLDKGEPDPHDTN